MKKNKKKILYLTEIIPDKEDSGGKRKTLQSITRLSKNNSVLVVSFANVNNFKQKELIEKKLGCKIFLIFSKKRNVDFKDTKLAIIHSFLKLQPLLLQSLRSAIFKKKVKYLLKKHNFDEIVIDHTFMAQYLPTLKKQKWILEEHNIEYQVYWSLFITSTTLKKKLFYFFESVLVFVWEKSFLKRFDYIYAISEQDKKKIKEITKKNNILLAPLYIPTEFKRTKIKKTKKLLFVGDQFWEPNKQAITWFCNKVLPIIHQVDPDISLTLVGKINHDLTIKYNRNVIFTGYVESVRDLLKQQFISILPFKSGSGIRLKALEAMSYGIPIISTEKGVYGLNVTNNQECIITSANHLDFADKVIKLVNNLKMQKLLTKNSYSYLQRFHQNQK